MTETIGKQILDTVDAWKDYNRQKNQLETKLAPLYSDYLKFMHEHGQIPQYSDDFKLAFKSSHFGSPTVLIFEDFDFPNKRREVPISFFENPEEWKQQKLKDIAAAQETERIRLLKRKREMYEMLKKELGE